MGWFLVLTILLILTVTLLFIDSLLYSYFVVWWGIFLLVPVGGLIWLIYKLNLTEDIKEKNITGWYVGKGLDITNPDEQKNVGVTFDENSLDLGSLFIGGPGSGKSMTVAAFVQWLCEKIVPNGYSFFDGKGDFDIYQLHIQSGARPDYFFSSELKSSDTINVMSAPTEAVVDYLSRVLIKSDNPYYGPAQQAALRKVIPLLKAFDVPCNLKDLWAILTVREAAEHLIELGEKQEVDRDILSNAKQYFSQDETERLKTIDGMLNVLFPFVSGFLKDRVNAYEPTLDIKSAVNQGKRVFYHLPLSQSALEVSIMITEMLGVVAKDRQLDVSKERPLHPLLFDDWGKFIYGNFGPITARCRSAQMPVSFTFQSSAQTDAVEYGGIFTKEITDNIGAFISLRVNGITTSKWVAEQFGTYETTQVGKSEQSDSNRSSVNFIELPRVRPDSIRDMDAGEAYVNIFASGEAGRLQNKRYKLRFPMPSVRELKPSNWPVIPEGRPNDDCQGLHLYRDFMDEDQLKERKRQAVIEELKDEGESFSGDEFDQEADYL